MNIQYKLTTDLMHPGVMPRVDVVQGDVYSRSIELSFYQEEFLWKIPENAHISLRYAKPDGTRGIYDTLPDGTAACICHDNVVEFTLAPQMLTVPGPVLAQVVILQGKKQLASFTMQIHVHSDPSAGATTSEDYVNWMNTAIGSQVDRIFQEAKDSGVFNGPAGPAGKTPRIEAARFQENLRTGVKLTVINPGEGNQLDQETRVQLFDGEKGASGVTPNIQRVEVQMLEPGMDAAGEISGTAEDLTLKLAIPEGAQGPAGPQGEPGPQGERGPSGTLKNWLDNSYFLNVVNQRQQTRYEGTGNAIDRWESPAGGLMTIEYRKVKDWVGTYAQMVTDYNFMGIPITMAAKFADGSMAVGSAALSQNLTYIAAYTRPDGFGERVEAAITSQGFIEISISSVGGNPPVWAALYIGEYAEENLPEYQYKGYAAELMECRRYYIAPDAVSVDVEILPDGEAVTTAVSGTLEKRHIALDIPRQALGMILRYDEQTLTEEQKAQARANIGLGAGSNIEPAEDDIPKVFFGAALPQTKNDTVMSFRYISKTADISGYCETKAQGNSSMDFPKKNQTVKLYKDAECTEKLKVDFKGWGEQNKFCFKANWIDLTHARNIVSARLWGDVVKSRANYDTIPELLRTSPNEGAVDGFPVKVYANGIYQGRYTINIPKDAWMANMDKDLDNHCILCGEDYNSGCFRAEANIDGSDWTDEVHDAVPEAIKTRWNEAIRFVMNSTDEEFVSGIGNFFDIESLIDYYIFGVMICNTDGFGKNQLFHTYDGQKWYATVYDMDCTFGTYFAELFPSDYPRSSFEDFDDGREGNLLYIRLENLFTDAIKERYLVLKDGALSLDNIINRFERFTDICPKELVEEDYASTTAGGAFSEIPLKDKNNIQQIRNYIAARYSYVESYIMSLGITGNLLYRLPEETTFDGVDDYLDTGVKLFETAQDFTIICEATIATDAKSYKGIYTAYANDNGGAKPAAGVQLTTLEIGQYAVSAANDEGGVFTMGTFSYAGTNSIKHVLVVEGGIPMAQYYIPGSGGEVLEKINTTGRYVYNAHSYSLQLGCKVGWYQAREGFCPMTMHSFEVWDYAMTAEEAKKKLEEM